MNKREIIRDLVSVQFENKIWRNKRMFNLHSFNQLPSNIPHEIIWDKIVRKNERKIWTIKQAIFNTLYKHE